MDHLPKSIIVKMPECDYIGWVNTKGNHSMRLIIEVDLPDDLPDERIISLSKYVRKAIIVTGIVDADHIKISTRES